MLVWGCPLRTRYTRSKNRVASLASQTGYRAHVPMWWFSPVSNEIRSFCSVAHTILKALCSPVKRMPGYLVSTIQVYNPSYLNEECFDSTDLYQYCNYHCTFEFEGDVTARAGIGGSVVVIVA